ncbi:hypothetical protein MC885_011165 [Smutsia gigantea]|nr:hypothetical protein MC885_011165 [Smutsia gigantea]
MSLHQKNPQGSQSQHLQSCSETQGLQAAQISEALAKSHVSSPRLMPGNSKESPAAGVPSTREGAQGFLSSPVAITATSSSRSGERSSGHKEEESTARAAPRPAIVPIPSVREQEAALMKLMLLKYRMKEPVTKADMLKVLIPVCEKHFSDIFLKACQHLEGMFGLDVKAVDPRNHCYELVISMGLTYDGMLSGEESVPKTGVLILVLGVILTKGGCAAEREVWKVLNQVGIHAERVHPLFGDPRELITNDLVKEKYVEYRQVANRDPAQFEFLWGPRAYAETTKMKVLQSLAKVYGVEPSAFGSQYEDALRDEEKRARATMSATAASPSGAPAGSSAKSSRSSCP